MNIMHVICHFLLKGIWHIYMNMYMYTFIYISVCIYVYYIQIIIYVHVGILHIMFVHIFESFICRVFKNWVLFTSFIIPRKSSHITSLNHTSLSVTLLNLHSSFSLICLFIMTSSAFQFTSSLFNCVHYPICHRIQPYHIREMYLSKNINIQIVITQLHDVIINLCSYITYYFILYILSFSPLRPPHLFLMW